MLTCSATASHASPSLSSPEPPKTLQIAQKRFIIIDDDDVFLLLHPKFLTKFLPGCQVQGFLDPVQGLQALYNLVETASPGSVPPVLLLDLRMPGLSGWDVLDRLAQRFDSATINDSLHIYLLTSSDDPTDRKRAAGYDIVNGYLVKPLTQHLVLTHFGQA